MAELHPVSSNPASTPESLSGTIIGRFRISSRLGGGGMGEVYRAEDPKLKRTVAIKRLAPQLRADLVYRRRFLQEAERVSRFSDAHVAALYDVLEEQGEIFLVMEYIEGETLRQRLRRPFTLDEFFNIAIQCAEGLAAAHANGIVHCDIKPENIMITVAGQVKILDFGVAKYLPRSDQSSTIDRSGTMAGTPAYMSPEVLLEKVPDGRADVFSLGVVFYEALTGHHPFLASSFVATTDRIRNETPTPIRIFNRKVPEGLEVLVNKAMAKDPALRYPDSHALLEDLRLVQSGLTPSTLKPLLPPLQTRKKSRWLIGIAMAVLVLGVAVITLHHRAQSKPVLTERGWVFVSDLDSSGDEAVPASGMREALTIAMQQSRYVNVFPRSRAYETLQRMQKQDVPRIDENLGREICRRENLQILLAGSIVRMGVETQITIRAVNPGDAGIVFIKSTRFRNDDFFDKADSLARSVRESLGESLAADKNTRPLARVTTKSLAALQLYTQAKDAMDQGKEDLVPAPLQAALQLDPDFAMAHLLLGNHYLAVANKNEKAIIELKRAYDLRRGVTDREQRAIEADYYGVQERYGEAVQSLIVSESLYPDDPETRLTLAEAYYALGQLDKAIAEFRQVVKLDPHSVSAYGGLVWNLAQSNQNDEALRVYQEALQQDLDSPTLQWAAGLAYLGQGKVAQARDQFSGLQKSSVSHRGLGELYLVRTDIYEGKLSSARSQLETGVRKDVASTEKGIQMFRRALLGRLALLLGNPHTARQQADAILAAPANNRQTSDVLSAGILYARSGELTLARQVLRQLQNAQTEIPTPLNKSNVAKLTGEIALAEGKFSDAIDSFAAAGAGSVDVNSHLGLARAFEGERDWPRAAQEWEQVVNARGEILAVNDDPAVYALAHLQLARSYRKLNNHAKAQAHYQEFLQVWRQSDDLHLKRAAADELKELTGAPVSQQPPADKK